jgi:ribosome-associated protein
MYDESNTSHDDDEIEIEAIGINVDSQPIELYKVLKMANVVSGGGEAKYAIAEGYVAVNGEIELRKRRKLIDGDLIEFNNDYYIVICEQPITVAPNVIMNSAKEVEHKSPKRERTPAKSKPTSAKPKPGSANSKATPLTPSEKSKKEPKKKNTATIEAGVNGGRSRIHFGQS